MSEELKPCPFCSETMKISPHTVNKWAVCPTEGCIGARQTIVLDDPKQVAAWNRRASPTTEGWEGGEALPSFAQIYSELEKARENLNRRYLNNNDQSAGRSSRAVFSAMCLLDTARALSPLVKDTTK